MTLTITDPPRPAPTTTTSTEHLPWPRNTTAEDDHRVWIDTPVSGAVVVGVRGPRIGPALHELRAALAHAVAMAPRLIVVNLFDVAVVEAREATEVESACRRTRATFRIVTRRPAVFRVLRDTRLWDLAQIDPTITQALRAPWS